MADATKIVDLKVDQSLLDAKFDGYKLSLEAFPCKCEPFRTDVLTCTPSESQYSFEHVRLFSSHNHLHYDFWNPDNPTFFVVEKSGAVVKLILSGDDLSTSRVPVFVVALPEDFSNRGDRYNITLSFPSEHHAFLSDGCGQLFLLNTGESRSTSLSWQTLLHCNDAVEDRAAFVIADSVQRESSLDCLLLSVNEVPAAGEAGTKMDAHFLTRLHWLTFSHDGSTWSRSRVRVMQTTGSLKYVALSREFDGLCVASNQNLQFVSDSLLPIAIAAPTKPTGAAPTGKKYSWAQTLEDVCAMFTVPDVHASQVEFILAPAKLRLAIKHASTPAEVLIDGELGGDVDSAASTWTLTGNRIEVTLQKRNACMWTVFVVGDERRAEYVPDPELVREMHDRLAAFTSDEMGTTDQEAAKTRALFDAQQLEECDMQVDETETLAWIDGNTHRALIETDIGGRQWIFSTRLDARTPPAICLRHDVDALMWRVAPTPTDSCWKHFATFNAFGYVQASKEQRKFCVAPPDCSYVALVDDALRAYVYWQPQCVDDGTELRHRPSGRVVAKIAKQQLITLNAAGQTADGGCDAREILGAVATGTHLFILTRDALRAFRVAKMAETV